MRLLAEALRPVIPLQLGLLLRSNRSCARSGLSLILPLVFLWLTILLLSRACILEASATLVWLALPGLWSATAVLALLGEALILSAVHVLRVVVVVSGRTVPISLLVLLVALEVVIVAPLLLLLRMTMAAAVAIVATHLALLLLHAATLAVAIGIVVPLVSLREVLSLSLH